MNNEVLDLANRLSEKATRELTVYEFILLTSLVEKYGIDLIKETITTKLLKNYLESPVSYLKAVLEAQPKKEKLKSIIRNAEIKKV